MTTRSRFFVVAVLVVVLTALLVPAVFAQQPVSATPTPTVVAQQAQVSDCVDLNTRDERLTCLDPIWRSGGNEAWLEALGFEGQLISVDSRQPDEYQIAGHGSVVRGVQVTVSGTIPSGVSCVTTDKPSRVPSYGFVYYISSTNPVVGMYGGGLKVDGSVSVWGDCTDWPEWRLAGIQAGFAFNPGSVTFAAPSVAVPAAVITVTQLVTSTEVEALKTEVAELSAQLTAQKGVLDSLVSEFQKFLGCLRNPGAVGCQ